MQINSSANSLVWRRLEDKNNFRSKNDNNMIDNFVNRKVGNDRVENCVFIKGTVDILKVYKALNTMK